MNSKDSISMDFKSRGFTKARLTVSQKNQRAQNFYQRRGWKFIGPDPSRPLGLLMEKDFTASTPAPKQRPTNRDR